MEPMPDGGVRMTLDVCLDRALQSWILSFGPFARVVAPDRLAKDIAGQIEKARGRYPAVKRSPADSD
jgi:predicted DNA-binding transcriptional regulator YafY